MTSLAHAVELHLDALRALLWVLWATGIGPSELIRLRDGDVDLVHGAVQLAKKLAPLPKRGAEALRLYMEARGRRRHEELFLARTGGPLTTSGVESLLR